MSYRNLLLTLLLAIGESSDNPKVKAYKQFYDKLNEKSVYVKPILEGSNAVKVGVTIYTSKLDFRPKNKKLNVIINFRQNWTDERLANDSPYDIVGKQELADKIWIPDTYFPSSSSVKLIKYPTPNIFVRITPKGVVTLSQRFQTLLNCKTNAHRSDRVETFEYDVLGRIISIKLISTTDMYCLLDVLSYGYRNYELVYSLTNGESNFVSYTSMYTKEDYTFEGVYADTHSYGNTTVLSATFDFNKIDVNPQISNTTFEKKSRLCVCLNYVFEKFSCSYCCVLYNGKREDIPIEGCECKIQPLLPLTVPRNPFEFEYR